MLIFWFLQKKSRETILSRFTACRIIVGKFLINFILQNNLFPISVNTF
jgi:hypothetical protein